MQMIGEQASAQCEPIEVYLENKEVPTMAPQIIGAPSQNARKTRSSVIYQI